MKQKLAKSSAKQWLQNVSPKVKQFFAKLSENRWLQAILPIVCLAVIILVFGLATKGRFVTKINLNMIVDQALIVAVVATGASYISQPATSTSPWVPVLP